MYKDYRTEASASLLGYLFKNGGDFADDESCENVA